MEILHKAVDFILMDEPDVVICTGDITSTGQPSEFDQALEILGPLIEHPHIEFLYIPGNHDVYVRNQRCVEALQNAFSKINGNNFSDLPIKKRIKE